MVQTSITLLSRMKEDHQSEAWCEFVKTYESVINRWIGRFQVTDPEDVHQEVLVAVLLSIKSFERQRNGSFRSWLRRVVHHRVLASLKQKSCGFSQAHLAFLDQLVDDSSEPSLAWDTEHNQFFIRQALDRVKHELGDTDGFKAFVGCALEGHKPVDVAERLGVTVGYVYLSKHRVLRKLRDYLVGLIDGWELDSKTHM